METSEKKTYSIQRRIENRVEYLQSTFFRNIVNGYKLFSKKSSIVDFRLGSKYASSVNHQMAYFINRIFRKSGPLEKAGPGSIEEADPIPAFTVLVKNTLMTNYRGC